MTFKKFFQDLVRKLKDQTTESPNEQLLQGQTYDFERYSEQAKCNIVLIGKTGVGKSTLINTILRTELAPAGSGRPVTQKLNKYEQPNCLIVAFDTKGLELTDYRRDDNESITKDVDQLIQGKKNEYPGVKIDVIYYCVNTGADRLEDIEQKWIKELKAQHNNIPIIVVLTKTTCEPEKDALFNVIKNGITTNGEPIIITNDWGESILHCITNEDEIITDKNRIPVIPILAVDKEITDTYTFKAQNLDLLVKQTASLLEEQAKQVFISEQIASIDLKVQEAQKLVSLTIPLISVFAAITPALNVSGTILLPTQMLILKQISLIFGLKEEEHESLSLLLSSELEQFTGAVLTASVGTAVTNFLPLGSAADAAVAGGSTSLLCLWWINMLKRHHSELIKKTRLNEDELKKFVESFVNQYKDYCSKEILKIDHV